MKSVLTIITILCISACVFSQPKTLFNKADSIFNNQNYTLAKTEYENIFKTDPGTALAWNRLAFSCYNLGQFDEAIKHFTKSLSLNPSDQIKPIVLSRLAKSFAAKGDKGNAITSLQKAVDAGYWNLKEINSDKNFQVLTSEPEFMKIKEAVFAKMNPCMVNPKNREFDFWVGDWDVFDAKTGRRAGSNSITIVSGGCVLLENWVDVSETNTGTSINYVNTETGKWEQVYKDNTAGMPTKYTDGECINGVMKFSVLTKGADGKIQTGRFVFEKKGADEVRQYQEMTGDDGKTWNMEFDLIYERRK